VEEEEEGGGEEESEKEGERYASIRKKGEWCRQPPH